MTQVNIPAELIKEIKNIMDSHPTYKAFGLFHQSDYVLTVLKNFVSCNGDFQRRVFREEVDRILVRIVAGQEGE